MTRTLDSDFLLACTSFAVGTEAGLVLYPALDETDPLQLSKT